MNIREAREAIGAILDGIDDDDLPEFDRVEQNAKHGPVAWWGGNGYYIASPSTGKLTEERRANPDQYRDDATWRPIEMEMVYRASKRYFADGGELIRS